MKIGVLIATYNGEKFIKEQLDSIINQTTPVNEIIISDDGSTDGTLEIILEYIDKYDKIGIKLVNNTVQHGVAYNFENAFRNSTADFLFFCDQDDVWIENKVEVFIEAEKKHPKCGLYFSNAELVDKNLNSLGKTVWDSFYWEGLDKPQYQVLEGEEIVSRINSGNIVTGMCAASRREVIENIFPVLPNMLHDDMIAAYCAINDSILAINEVTAYYRQHDNNVVGAFVENRKKKSFIERFICSSQRMKDFCFSYIRCCSLYSYDKKKKYSILQISYLFFQEVKKYYLCNKLVGFLGLLRLYFIGKINKKRKKISLLQLMWFLSITLFVSTRKRREYLLNEV